METGSDVQALAPRICAKAQRMCTKAVPQPVVIQHELTKTITGIGRTVPDVEAIQLEEQEEPFRMPKRGEVEVRNQIGRAML